MEREHVQTLAKAYKGDGITLYLGAGVSAGSGVPTWEHLVLTMFFATAQSASLEGWRPFSNYLYAIAEWYLARQHEPLEITASKLRRASAKDAAFLARLKETLYGPFVDGGTVVAPKRAHLRSANLTLGAVAALCEGAPKGSGGVRSVITYNYDGLLEAALDCAHAPVWNADRPPEGKLPIYHVHGFVPFPGRKGSKTEEIVFTEEQYHQASHDPYSWGNIVQLGAMTARVGLTVGLSLADRNIRRLLDAASRTPVPPRVYALLQRAKWKRPDQEELQSIHEKAQVYLARFQQQNSGIKGGGPRPGIKGGGPRPGIKGPSWAWEIERIIETVEHLDQEFDEKVLVSLGIQPIWYTEHSEVPQILAKIMM
jgi:hypothetical protein